MSSDTIGSFSNWVYIDGDNDALNLIFNVQNYALSTYLGLYCSTVGATTTWAAGLVADGTALWDFMYSGGSPIDNWTHVVLTHDGTTPKLYINGTNVNITFNVETDKTAWMKTMFDGISPPSIFMIGAFLSGGNPIYILRGNSQDFRYFNETFNQSEIDYLNNSGNGRTESLSKFSPPQFKNILKLQNKSNILPGIKIPVRF